MTDPTVTTPQPKTNDIDRRRYTRITRFFAQIIGHIIFWDLVMGRIPFVRGRVKGNRAQRHQKLARRFRLLAVEMGGVLIKLGQFLSARVDVLPEAITNELKGLQDAVPPIPAEKVKAAIAEALGDSEQYFEFIEELPLAAASLGQTHRARLLDSAEPVVIKVQRPDIDRIVNTDLAALRVVARWVMRYKPIRRRANVPALMEEFARTMWEELDYKAEVANGMRFAAMFVADDEIYAPRYFNDLCSSRLLVMENVEAIKVTDTAAMIEAGIEPKAVADRLLDSYFKQFFEDAFFHADPHPGNLFVRPMPDLDGETGRFVLIFIDFGMMGRIEGLRDDLRKVLTSVMLRDGKALTDAYQSLGFFLPGADLERMAEVQEQMMERISGRSWLDIANPDPAEIQEVTREFKDVLFEFPFQVPHDFIYLGRALGMLSGLTSQLDPEINPWTYFERYGRRVMEQQEVQQFTRDAIIHTLKPILTLPHQIDRFLQTAREGKLRFTTQPDRRTEQRLVRLERRMGQLNSTLLATGGLLAGTLLFINDNSTPAYLLWGFSAVVWLFSAWRGR